MRTDRWLMLYRPTAPSARAQAIQTLHSAHALAGLGAEVWVAVEAPQAVSAAEILAYYGLAPVPGLRLSVLPASRSLASVAWRAWIARFLATGGGVVYARSKRYAAEVLPWLGRRSALVVEAHEVDSSLAAERGEDPAPWLALEREVLGGAAAVVCNAGGTLACLREVHPKLPPALVAHNGTHVRPLPPGGEGVGVVGSVRAAKDAFTVAKAARLDARPWTWVGADDASPLAAALRVAAGASLRLEPPVPHAAVAGALARFEVLVIPLSDGLFGRSLTSPLKLWDALASGRKLVVADLSAANEVVGLGHWRYTPGDAASLLGAVQAAAAARVAPAPLVRTWAERAREIRDFVAAASGPA